MKLRLLTRLLAAAGTLLAGIGFSADSAAQNARAVDARSKAVFDHWTPARINSAIPRDLLIDERGLGYMRLPGNSLVPYGHNVSAQAAGTLAESIPPLIENMSPANGATIGASATFSAKVTDASGVKSVKFYIRQGTGRAQQFAGGLGANNVWSVNLSGFTNGSWSWYVVANDAAKPSNSRTSPTLTFTVNTSTGGGGGGGGSVSDANWTSGGVVQNAAGRIYFEMPANAARTRWDGYVCSGTVVSDGSGASDRSTILTAAHCVYDDANKAFARNVMFIPNQAQTTAAGTDLTCSNDPIGCWAPNFGVVDVNWTTRTFPDNVHWDYAFYVVRNTGAHTAGRTVASDTLDAAVTPMSVQFSAPTTGSTAYALGYSYDVDPLFRYCTDPLQNMNADNWWLPGCGLSGGSSGGPWVQPMNVSQGNGPVISVNSWGYTTQPGMAGPKLSGTSATCVFSMAKASGFGTFADGDAGYLSSATSCPAP